MKTSLRNFSNVLGLFVALVVALFSSTLTPSSNAASAPQLRINKAAGNNLQLSWTGSVSKAYQVQAAGDVATAPLWNNTGPFVLGELTNKLLVNTAYSRQFFRLRESAPVIGEFISPINNSKVSGMLSVAFNAQTVGTSKWVYAELIDRCLGRSNVLGIIESNIPNPTFVVDTRYMQTGKPHELFIRLLDNYGTNTLVRNEVHEGMIGPCIITPTNQTSLNGFTGITGWKFYQEMTTTIPAGRWILEGRDQNTTLQFLLSGEIEQTTNQDGVIIMEDNNGTYPYDWSVYRDRGVQYFDVSLHFEGPSGDVISTFPIVRYYVQRRDDFAAVNIAMLDNYTTNGVKPTNLWMSLSAVQRSLNQQGVCYSTTYASEPWAIGVYDPLFVTNAVRWTMAQRLLAGLEERNPQRMHYFGYLQDGNFLGYRDDAAKQVFISPGHSKMTFMFIDGCNGRGQLMGRLVDTIERPYEDYWNRGMVPCFAITFAGMDFPKLVGGDVSLAFRAFRTEFYSRIEELDPSGWPCWTYGEALAFAQSMDTNVVGKIRITGGSDLRTVE